MVTVGGGSSRPVKFTVTRKQPGTYSVIMGSQRASFQVTGDSSSSPSSNGAVIAMILLGLLVVAVIIVIAYSYLRRPSY